MRDATRHGPSYRPTPDGTDQASAADPRPTLLPKGPGITAAHFGGDWTAVASTPQRWREWQG